MEIEDLKSFILKAQSELQMAYDSLSNGDWEKAALRIARVHTAALTINSHVEVLKQKKEISAANPVDDSKPIAELKK